MSYVLIGADGRAYPSAVPGTVGGHRRSKVYGRLDCPSAARAIARGHYLLERVFFADAATAIAAGYRPCAVCLPDEYAAWKYSPLPDIPIARTAAVPCGAREIDALLRMAAGESIVLGGAGDTVSRANARRIAAAWNARDGLVLDTVHWPEQAASWLRQARRFAAHEPDTWIVTGTAAGWVGMARRLAYSTGWSARRTLATAGLADPTVIAGSGLSTCDGMRGAYADGHTWEINRTVIIARD